MLRFHFPLIEPDGRFSRIRLSDKESCFRFQEGGPKLTEVDEIVPGAQLVVGES